MRQILMTLPEKPKFHPSHGNPGGKVDEYLTIDLRGGIVHEFTKKWK
jgi:hypothetical protein